MIVKEFEVEIMRPGSMVDTWATYESNEPFISLSKGDIINTKVRDTEMEIPDDMAMTVSYVEHIFWESPEGIHQKAVVYTSLKKKTDLKRAM